MRMLIGGLLGLFGLAFSSHLAAFEPQEILKDPDYYQVSLSPDGKHIGLLKKTDDGKEILIVDSKTMKAVNVLVFPEDNELNQFYWATDERLIVDLSSESKTKNSYQKRSDFDRKISKSHRIKVRRARDLVREFRNTDLYAINIDNSEGKFIFGKRAIQKRGQDWYEVSKEKRQTHQSKPHVISIMPSDPEHILIRTHYKNSSSVFKLNIDTGGLERWIDMEYRPQQFKYFDSVNELWNVSYENKQAFLEKFHPKAGKWQRYEPKSMTRDLELIDFDLEKELPIVSDYCGNNTRSFCYFDPQRGKLDPFFNEYSYGVEQLFLSKKGEPVGYGWLGEYPQYKMTSNETQRAKVIAGLLDTFKGFHIDIEWQYKTANKALITVHGDVQAPTWYLFDANRKEKLVYVASERKSIAPKQLNTTYSFKFDSLDEVTIQGYATLPQKPLSSPPPAVVIFNSNIYENRMRWSFDPLVQFISAHGVAVVQVNHRGTPGFGEAFKNLGRPIHKDSILQDVIDAVDYLQKNKQISQKVCILGKDRGAQSAFKASLLAPKTFSCVISDSARFSHYEDESKNKYSLVNRADEQQVPVLLMYGQKGKEKLEYNQGILMQEALKKHKKVVEVYERNEDDYYLNDESHRAAHFEAMINFVLRYIK
ncbi:alpha/beta hydrolase family protein [Pleionea sediminis]|uniref:alpha/beta hydrolase family protein n=1 Tax=Pleionea sediminis TaxID=2569479 RepID=UPI001185D0A7|nr:prolyl oligopeptidase family serine peptidase [Pleionea sediminis]